METSAQCTDGYMNVEDLQELFPYYRLTILANYPSQLF